VSAQRRGAHALQALAVALAQFIREPPRAIRKPSAGQQRAPATLLHAEPMLRHRAFAHVAHRDDASRSSMSAHAPASLAGALRTMRFNRAAAWVRARKAALAYALQ
jgi:hypothetical protein